LIRVNGGAFEVPGTKHPFSREAAMPDPAGSGGDLRRLVEALQSPGAFDHPAGPFRIIETHISLILLTGPFAYKFKKPLDLGFLDFSTLDRRRHCCEEELRLNRRLAPEYYLAVAAVTGDAERPRIGGPWPALEYAVRMRQFPPDRELDRLAERGELEPSLMDRLAVQVAAFHAAAAVAPPGGAFGSFASIRDPALDNIRALLAGAAESDGVVPIIERLGDWTGQELARLRGVFAERQRDGRVRECHGDLHLGNIVLDGERPVIFDCIEFSEELRWIDVISDAAFLIMDLHSRGRPQWGWRFLDRYLRDSGDYAGLAVLRFYLVYRALVRAKVAAIRRRQPGLKADDHRRLQTRFDRHLETARELSEPVQPFLMITRGLSGSGKSWLTDRLLEDLGAVRLRSDVERKRLHGLAPSARSGSRIGSGLYDAASNASTYRRLAELAGVVLGAGYPVIVDATFLAGSQRRQFTDLAHESGAPFLILDLHADRAILERRIRQRATAANDASEADLRVLTYQVTQDEPLSAKEQARAIAVDTGVEIAFPALLSRIHEIAADSRRCAGAD
jgi:aminoglycoside phosphotransferase family enzyme/predicted kinase